MTVRFNTQMRAADVASLGDLRLKCNAHEMVVHGKPYAERRLLLRSHSVVSKQGELAVVEVVFDHLDDTFPPNKRAAFPVADLHLLLQDMTVPNVEVPFRDEGQAEVAEDDVAEEEMIPIETKLLGLDANFDDEDKDDGPERDGAGDHDQGNDTSTDRKAVGSYGYPRRDGD